MFRSLLLVASSFVFAAPAFASYDCSSDGACEVNLGPARNVGADGGFGNGVNVVTGNLHLSAADAATAPAIGPALGLRRHYNSQGREGNRGFGRGWTHTYAWRIAQAWPNVVRIAGDDGRAFYFAWSGSEWSPWIGQYGTLTGSATTGFTYVDRLGTTRTFDSFANAGRLLSVTIPESVSPITVYYDAPGSARITSVRSGEGYGRNGAGARLTFTWEGDFITGVSDDAGNTWVYGYDYANERLTSVGPPRVDLAGTPAEIAYEYATQIAGGELFDSGAGDGSGNTITRIRARQSASTWIDLGLYGYVDQPGDGCLVIRTATGEAGGSLQRLISFSYTLDFYSSTTSYSMSSVSGEISGGSVDGTEHRRINSITRYDWQIPMYSWAEWFWGWDLTLSSTTNFRGDRTDFLGYDARGNPLVIVEAAGTAVERTTSFTHHPLSSRLLTATRTSADGISAHTITYDYDADYDTEYNEAPAAFLTQIVETGRTDTGLDGALDETQTIVTRLFRDSLGRLTETQYANGKSESHVYFSSSAAPNNQYRLDRSYVSKEDASTIDHRLLAYDDNGRVTEKEDPNGTRTALTYDGAGLLLSRTVYQGASSMFEELRYDATGAVVESIAGDGGRLAYDYDQRGLLWRQTAFSPGGAAAWSETFTHDPASNLLVAERRFAGQGSVLGATCLPSDGSTDCTERRHDGLGRLLSIRTLGSTDMVCPEDQCEASYQYDGGGYVVAKIEPDGARGYLRDALGRLTRVTLPDGSHETYAWDINNHITARRDAKDAANGGGDGDRARTYLYDDFGNLLQITGNDAGTLRASYDDAGLVTRAAELESGRLTQFGYDALGRMTLADAGDVSIAYAYDETGLIGGDMVYTNTRGRLSSLRTRASDGTRLYTHYGYDYAGRLNHRVDERGTEAAPTFSISRYDRDANGNVERLRYPSGKEIAFGYALGASGYGPSPKPTDAIVDYFGAPAPLFSGAAYAADGGITSLTYGAGGTLSVTRNMRGEVTRMVSGPPGAPIVDQRYEYDASGLGRVVAVHYFQGLPNAYDWTFSYDAFGRAEQTSTNAGGVLEETSYTFDSVGNRTSAVESGSLTTYNYAPASDKLLALTGAKDETWTYDANGFVATHTIGTSQATSYTYDGFHRLKSVSDDKSCPGSQTTPASITFTWLATSCWAPRAIYFRINGTVALAADTAFNCSCNPGIGTMTVTDPAILDLLSNGKNTFTVEYDEYLAWAVVTIGGEDYVVYDQGGGGDAESRNPDLCGAGYAFAPGPQSVAPPFLGALEFFWNVTSCFAPEDIVFSINGQVALIAPGAFNCSCAPGNGYAKVKDPAVLALLVCGPNTISVQYGEYMAWAAVRVGDAGEVIVYDAFGGGDAESRNPDLCGAGYELDVSTSVPRSYTPRNFVSYEYNGDGTQAVRWESSGKFTKYYYGVNGTLMHEERHSGEQENGDLVTYQIDHVYAGNVETARVVRRCARPSPGAPRLCADYDLVFVHPDLLGRPAALESTRLASHAWAGNFDEMGEWKSAGSLPGADGKIGTKDDVPITIGNMKDYNFGEWEQFDSFRKELGQSGAFTRPSIGDRVGGPKYGKDLLGKDNGFGKNMIDSLLGMRLASAKTKHPPMGHKTPWTWYAADADAGTDAPTIVKLTPEPKEPPAGGLGEKMPGPADGGTFLEKVDVTIESPEVGDGVIFQFEFHFRCAEDTPNCGDDAWPPQGCDQKSEDPTKKYNVVGKNKGPADPRDRCVKTWTPDMGEPRIPGQGFTDPPSPDPDENPFNPEDFDEDAIECRMNPVTQICEKVGDSTVELYDPDYMTSKDMTPPEDFDNPCGGVAQCVNPLWQ